MSAVNKTQEVAAVDLGALLDAGDGAVVTLEVGETRLAAHKAVLSARSPVFAAMFQHDTLEASSGVVSIADVEGPVLRQLLCYCYTLQAPHLPAMAPHLLAAADKYGLTALKDACEQQVAAQLDVDNAAATAVLAVRHSCPNLTAAAVAFIKAHTYQVMATQGWAEAMKNQPDDLIIVSRLLADPPAKTRMPATRGLRTTSSTHSDHRQTPASAAAPIALQNMPPPDDTIVSRMRSLSGEERGKRLIRAAKEGSVEELRASVAAGADVGVRDSEENGNTALHWAAVWGQAEMVRCLVEAGAEMDIRNNYQSTPLHCAAINGCTAVVRLLVSYSADCNARNQWGMTPLHRAAEYGHAEAAAALLEAASDREARNNDGKTPLDLARQNYHQELIDLLTRI